MDAYIYQAALWCEDCANAVKTRLQSSDAHESGDSGDYPQGPYSDGGGEADSPQHCDDCGVFLENLLTDDGVEYVREQCAAYHSDDDLDVSWQMIADRADDDGQLTLAEWIRFYFQWG